MHRRLEAFCALAGAGWRLRSRLSWRCPRWRRTAASWKLFAESKGKNAVHGSDSDENAAREIAFFFPERELALLGVV